jgi:hypothetical protein
MYLVDYPLTPRIRDFSKRIAKQLLMGLRPIRKL